MGKRKRGNAEGSIYKMQDGRWRAAVTTGKDANGKPKRKTFTAATRHEVQDLLAHALRDLQLGLLVAPEKQTVGQFLTWWLQEVVKPTARPKTMKFYEFVTRIHLVPGLGRIPIQKLTAPQVQTFLNERLTTPSARTGKPLSARSVRHIHRTLCTALSCAVKYGNVARNVAMLADPSTALKPATNYFSV
jgi:integrase